MSHSCLVDVLLLSTFLVIGSNGIELQESASDRSAAASIMMKELEGFKMLANLADRDLNIWWGQFNQTMQNYTDIKDEKACTDPNGLNNTLILLEQKIDVYLEYGLQQKVKQLGEIKVIIEKEEFKNSTGLYSALKTYIEGHEAQARRERILLNNETKTVDNEIKWLKEKVCHCSWKTWAAWTNCSHDCNGGTQTRNRTFYARRNGGNFCDGNSIEIQHCNQGPCPVDCAWGEWGSWGTCSQNCMEGTKSRSRSIRTGAQHNGQACVGENSEQTSCNTKVELQQALNQTQRMINENEGQCRLFFMDQFLIIGGNNRNGLTPDVTTLDITRNKTCQGIPYPPSGRPGFNGITKHAGGFVSTAQGPQPLVCGGTHGGPAESNKCYLRNSSRWDLVHQMPTAALGMSAVSLNSQWMFFSGGYGDKPQGRRAFLLDGTGTRIDLPQLDLPYREYHCSAILSDDGANKVVGVISGGVRNKAHTKAFERYNCSTLGTPTCTKISNGPDVIRGVKGQSCGTLQTRQGGRVLLVIPRNRDEPLQLLDLTNENSSWTEFTVPTEMDFVGRGGLGSSFFTSIADQTTGYYLTESNLGYDQKRPFIYRIQCQNSTSCNFEKIWTGYLRHNEATAMAIPAGVGPVCP